MPILRHGKYLQMQYRLMYHQLDHQTYFGNNKEPIFFSKQKAKQLFVVVFLRRLQVVQDNNTHCVPSCEKKEKL